MAATTEFSSSTAGSSPPPAGRDSLSSIDSSGPSDVLFDRDTSSGTFTDDDAEIVRRNAVRAVIEGDPKSKAPGILDRRKTARQPGGRQGSVEGVIRGKSRRGLGPAIPIRVSPSPPPAMPSPGLMSPMRLNDDGESSDAFEDAAESVRTPSISSERPTSSDSNAKSESERQVGLGINGHAYKDEGIATPTHSRQPTAQKVPPVTVDTMEAATPPSLQQELERNGSIDAETDNEQTPVLPSHSRNPTAETVRSFPTNRSNQEQSQVFSPEMSPTRSSRSHSRQSTTETEPPVDLDSKRSSDASVPTHTRPITAEAIPNLPPTPSESERERSISPSKMSPRQRSPVRTVQGLSGEMPVSSPPPPSSIGRLQALEQRHIGDRPTSTSPPPGGLMRAASTRMGSFLGRMGSIRKPGKSPPGPRQEGRFALERRNTSQSITTLASNGDGLAAIADETEEADGAQHRPSLQTQFQNLRRQEERSIPDTNSHLDVEGNEKTPTSRSVSDAGLTSPTKESPESRQSRASSTPSLLRSPPMNPSLPAGTASGLTAGPAEEPRPVNWDLWQAVVNEGPSAVAKSSGEELKQAIASGIPAAIRGVVWQVLAESKNAELEDIYRTLKTRGAADSEHMATDSQRPTPMSRNASQNNVHDPADGEKDSQVSSSRSSIRSEQSTPATSHMASPPPSIRIEDQELKTKLLAEKQKREAANLTKLEKAIKRDLGSRTSYSKFSQAAGLQDGLFGVCKAYALFDEGVGYAQGINFILMPLLFNMTEEEAFTLLVRLMSKYDLRSMFTGDLAGLHLRLYQFERLLEDYDPALYCHLRRRNVGPQLYATQWFLTLFAYRFPLQLVVRVYDLIFSEGLTAIFKFGLVLMQHNRHALLAMKDMGHLTTFLKEKLFDVYIDKSPSASSLLDSGFFGSVTGGADKELYRADEMVRDACEIVIADTTLAQYAAEWKESQRQTQERESELENLRSANTNLSIRVKALEDRTQQQDTEHVTIASDLVRMKVENDGLWDENEGLKMKVDELQKLLDTQAAEIESRLQSEMDRILLRNSEVQNENRVLKEEQEEMEHQLVDTKMKHAQTQSDHDALLQKWANMQAMFSNK